MSPTSHLNVLLPRVRQVDDPNEPDNRIRNIVLAVIFSIFGAIAIAVCTYIGCLYWGKHKRNRQHREEYTHAQQVLAKKENDHEQPQQYQQH